MQRIKSGKFPGLWIFILLLLHAVFLSGCSIGKEVDGGSDNPEEYYFSSVCSESSDCHVHSEDCSEISSADCSGSCESSVCSSESYIYSDPSGVQETTDVSSELYADSTDSTSDEVVTETVTQNEVDSESETSSEAVPDQNPIIVPNIIEPSSPGVNVVVEEHGILDYSNASEGYISVRYTGEKSKAKLRIVCGKETYDHDVDPDGTVDYFPLSCGSGEYTVTLYEQKSGTKYTQVLQNNIEVSLNDATSPFLYPNRYVIFTQNSDSVYEAARLCSGKDDTIEKIAAVFGWVTENITYDYNLASTVKSGYIPDPDRTLSLKSGICFDYASLVAAMLRSQSVPTRLVIGYAAPDIYHAWNEVYTEETGWITPQLLLKNKGYNLVDATFYSGTDDKSKIAAYISNDANYSAMYYY